ncbi:MAG TPA: alanine--tRNA ligase-related protein, partial [Chlamydiales bacterium]|nr:alanine--tRNA ligase-related protein [Chlamydiales bacterium]
RIAEILQVEEEAFIRTLQRGGNILSTVIEKAEKGGRKITGEDAFKLKDTYGFPIEEIELIAKDMKLDIDLPTYEKLEEEAKQKSRKAHVTTAQKFTETLFTDYLTVHKPSSFVGYSAQESSSHIQSIIVDNAFTDEIKEGDEGLIILDTTPFYAEMGGQSGDSGKIIAPTGTFEVRDTISPFPGVIAHVGVLVEGKLKKQEKVSAKIDTKRRQRIANNHTATHLLHWSLEKVLGEHIRQAGSLVEAERFRFDFSHHKPLTRDQLVAIENLVNEKIRDDSQVKAYEISYDEAQKRKDIKQFFGEKYGAQVRVIDIDFSKELCGGTHTSRLGSIGLFKIQKEMSIAAGTRRIEALTGQEALSFVHQEEEMLFGLSEELKTPAAKLLERAKALLEENHDLSVKLKQIRQKELIHISEEMMKKSEHLGKFSVIAQEVKLTPDEMNFVADTIMNRKKVDALCLASVTDDRCQLIIRTKEESSLDAKALIQEVSSLIQGGGGGKKTSAQAGGKDPSGIPSALEKIRVRLRDL